MSSGHHIAILDDEVVVDPRNVREFVEKGSCLVEVTAAGFIALGGVETLVGSWVVEESGAEDHHGSAGVVQIYSRNTAGVASLTLAERVAVNGDTLCVAFGVPLCDVVEYFIHFSLDGGIAVEILGP